MQSDCFLFLNKYPCCYWFKVVFLLLKSFSYILCLFHLTLRYMQISFFSFLWSAVPILNHWPSMPCISSCHVLWNDGVSRMNFLHVVPQSFCTHHFCDWYWNGGTCTSKLTFFHLCVMIVFQLREDCIQKPDYLFMVEQQNYCCKYRQDPPYHKGVFHWYCQLKETSSVVKERAGTCLYLLE